ncbi:unnamed protein product [Dicrocoelium dendriticum]|nr:unnamed protein product [Dicrocoelium dendriticum]
MTTHDAERKQKRDCVEVTTGPMAETRQGSVCVADRAASASRAAAGKRPGPRTMMEIFVEKAMNQTNTPLAKPTGVNAGQMMQPHKSKSRAFDRLMAGQNRV